MKLKNAKPGTLVEIKDTAPCFDQSPELTGIFYLVAGFAPVDGDVRVTSMRGTLNFTVNHDGLRRVKV